MCRYRTSICLSTATSVSSSSPTSSVIDSFLSKGCQSPGVSKGGQCRPRMPLGFRLGHSHAHAGRGIVCDATTYRFCRKLRGSSVMFGWLTKLFRRAPTPAPRTPERATSSTPKARPIGGGSAARRPTSARKRPKGVGRRSDRLALKNGPRQWSADTGSKPVNAGARSL